ncbi:MAG: hypothetical protein ACRCX2_20435 [Paraclostridium sp.]
MTVLSYEDFVGTIEMFRGFKGIGGEEELKYMYKEFIAGYNPGKCPGEDAYISLLGSHRCDADCWECWYKCVEYYLENNTFWRLEL